MKVSRTWLQRYFADELPSVEKLADALTFHAFEIEEVVGDVLDVKVLPDRAGYALSHRGIAKELSAILKLPLKSDPLREPLPTWKEVEKLTMTVDERYVLRHTGALMSNVKVGPSPEWLKNLLEGVGQRSINNVVDASNFVMLDIGQPTHAFDRDKIESKDGMISIAIREAKVGEEVKVLTGETYTLAENMFVVGDATSGTALDLAGLKGGLSSGVTNATTNLFISSGNYDGELIRKMSQRLGLMTDASHRFQNRPSPELTAYGMRDLVNLLEEVAGGVFEGVVDIRNISHEEKSMSVTTEKVVKQLGALYTDENLREVFSRLNLSYTEKDGTFVVTPPFERTDISISEDLIEEVGRIIGYDHVLPLEMSVSSPLGLPDHIQKIEAIKDFLVGLGFNEVSTYTMLEQGDLELAKPLADDKKYLRTNLAAGHKKALEQNSNYLPLYNLSDVRLFEIGRVWPKGEERTMLGMSYWSRDKKAAATKAELFAEVTKGLEELFSIRFSGVETGDTLEFDLSQLDAAKTPEVSYALSKEGVYQSFSVYPFALRDIAVWTPLGTKEEGVRAIVATEAGDLLLRINLFDEFQKDGQISYAYNLVLQAQDRTLTDQELAEVMEKITNALNGKDWKVR